MKECYLGYLQGGQNKKTGCHNHATNLGLASVLINAIKIPSLEESRK